ncbi:MAG TPA: hypothetical protein VKQ72_13670 [Aggregatilineales bacterium]|nr:hypothetical protein [Aggregatilineales bacterium]
MEQAEMEKMDMTGKGLRYRSRGQGQVEYALVLAVVSLVVIVAVTLVGLGAQRVYGVIAGSLGAKHDTLTQGHTIEIVSAQCIAVPSQNLTGLWVVGNTDELVANLTGSTNLAVGTGIGGAPSPVNPDPDNPNVFKFQPLLSQQKADLTLCPIAVVIQATDGAIATAPITRVTE